MHQHLDVPTDRTAPHDFVRCLRDVDPTCEILYMGEGRWIAGVVRPSPERRVQGRSMYERATAELRRVRAHPLTKPAAREAYLRVEQKKLFAQAVMQGFGPIADYHFQGEPDARVIRDLREALWWERNDRHGDEARKRIADKDPDATRKRMADPALAREAARMMRQPVSITSPGLTT